MLWFRRKAPTFPSHIWWAAGAVLFVKCFLILMTSVRGLANMTWLIDDSFIEMRVARNLGMGAGFSLDGINPTTGAPFFWIYLTSLNHFFLGKEAAIRATLMESALLGALATVVVFHIAQKLTQDRRIAWTAFLLSTFTANAFLNAMNGMDTALFTFLVLLTVALTLDVGRSARMSSFAWGCLVGLSAGLMLMTRGDAIFVVFSILCVKLYEYWRSDRHARSDLRRWMLGTVLVSGICFGFFMTWQLIQTGSPFPGNQVGRRGLALAMHNFSFDHFSPVPYLQIVFWNVFQLENLLTVATGGSVFALAALVYGTLQKRMRAFGILTIIYLAVFLGMLAGYQWYFADLHGLRYLNPAAHILFVFIAAFVWQIPAEMWRKTAVAVVTASLILLASYKHYQMTSRFPSAPYLSYIGMPDPEKNAFFWSTIDWMKANLPAGTIVGVRDYGRVSMFTDVLVQDLAGNIDPEVAVALRNGTLKEYLKSKHVEYLLIPTLEQRSDVLYQYLHREMPLRLMKDAPQSYNQNLYKIIW